MKINIVTKLQSSDGVILFAYGEKKPNASLQMLGVRAKKIAPYVKQVSPKYGHCLVVPNALSGATAICVGLGSRDEMTDYKFENVVHLGVREAQKWGLKKVVIVMPHANEHNVFRMAVQSIIASYTFTKYTKAKLKPVQSVSLLIPKRLPQAPLQKVLTRAQIIGEEINASRDIANIPGSDMTPTILARHAQETGKRCGFSVNVFDEKKMKQVGFGGILGVSHGSAEEAKFIICEYTPKQAVNKKPIVFIGKGVTFDTGGLNIKPDMSMYEMHMDMSGGAAVIHAIAGIARLGLPVRVVALIPTVENMPGSAGYRPGDILKTYSGKTIEVKHTDAEGRIILADALGYAKTFSPEVIIDVATLTGAALVALGQRVSAVMSTDEALQKTLIDLGMETGDRVWPLPLWPEYREDVKAQMADVQNIGKTRFGGTITGGAFLWEFAPIKKWAHIDIAPTMTTIDEQHLAPGSRGASVRLLIRFAQHHAQTHNKKSAG